MTKFIFITGGVVSSLGKGITAASLGRLMKARGYSVVLQKLDPYLNVDPGTMNPFQHGEVFVTEDGGETDLDLGHYERFLDRDLTKDSNVTAGSVYWNIVTRERHGDYLGETVQVIPHVTDEIKNRIIGLSIKTKPDVQIIEIGGTVGDIESLPFLEAIRQLRKDLGRENVCYIHVTLIPYLPSASELKTKPTQHSVKELRSIGIQPHIIVCRTDRPLTEDLRKKIALFCDVEPEAVIQALDVENIYEVPIQLQKEGLDEYVIERLELEKREAELSDWLEVLARTRNINEKIRIAVVGKYIRLPDAYISIVEALNHAGYENNVRVTVDWVDAEELTKTEVEERLSNADGILVPGGFGVRGIEGKINAIRFARESGIPFLGICLGLQCAVIEFARNVVHLEHANSSEFDDKTPYPVIDFLPEQKSLKEVGATMRLGGYSCRVFENTNAYRAYEIDTVIERHRHRYEVNNFFLPLLEKRGLKVSGVNEERNLVEIIELENHPWFVACQFHPEFKSRPTRAHPLFREFVKKSSIFKEERAGIKSEHV